MPSNENRTELCFLDVPAPQSGHVVEQLEGKPGFTMAAAVYSGVDVIATIEGTDVQIDEAHRMLAPQSAPNVNGLEPFRVDSVVQGPNFSSREMLINSSCVAFVRCAIRTDEVPMVRAGSILATLPGVTRLFSNSELHEVVLEVVAPSKEIFDQLIMSSIQGQWSVVKSTRTFLLINSMCWRRPALDHSPIFVSTAKSDLHRALWLSGRIESDVGLNCWTYNDIPIGTASWTQLIDTVIDAAPLKIFLLSKAALESEECQREFGRTEAVSDSNDICCVLLPDCEISDLPTRYRQRQCLATADFRSYPLLVDWIHERLKATHI
jgi:hypothetical protein